MNQRRFGELKTWVRKQVGEHRFRHIQGVVQASRRLAAKHGLSTERAMTAAWLHDCGKELSRAEMAFWLKKGGARLDTMEKALPALWHPHVGSVIARYRWGIRDAGILEAIRCHTLGHPKMKALAQVVFIADFIEPNRDFKGVLEARRQSALGLKEGVRAKASQTITFLLEKKMRIHPRLLETWNAFLEKD